MRTKGKPQISWEIPTDLNMHNKIQVLGKGLSILPLSNKQTVVSREFLELHSMTGTVETVFASSIARCDAIWAIYFTFKLFLRLLMH